jgi:hypothetical protein
MASSYSCVGYAALLLSAVFPVLTYASSVQRGGRVEIIANDQGHRITPSWVSFTDEERL